jgi:ribosomal protein L11 methyltransferase
MEWYELWPTRVGVQRLGSLTISPPHLAGSAEHNEHLVVIEPAGAFGTGEHETTRGSLRLLQQVLRPGDSVADIGAGSAVLSIAAAKLGARAVFAIEIDSDAIGNAESNVALNGVADRVVVLNGDASAMLPVIAPVRLILANTLSSVLLALSPLMLSSLQPGGAAVVSGVLAEERDDLLVRLGEDGWECTAEDTEGDWWSGVLQPR